MPEVPIWVDSAEYSDRITFAVMLRNGAGRRWVSWHLFQKLTFFVEEIVLPIRIRPDLPPDKTAQERYRERVASVAVLVDQSGLGQLGEHLTHLAGAERLVEDFLRFLDDVLHRERVVAMGKAGDGHQQIALTIRGPPPTPGEEVV